MIKYNVNILNTNYIYNYAATLGHQDNPKQLTKTLLMATPNPSASLSPTSLSGTPEPTESKPQVNAYGFLLTDKFGNV